MKILFYFIFIIIVGVIIELIASYMKKNNFESKFPTFRILNNILQSIIVFIIVILWIYIAYKDLFETGTIDNLAHIFMLFIPIIIIIYLYNIIRQKIKKDNKP